MKSPNFNQARRSEAKALSHEPDLDRTVDHVLEMLEPFPANNTDEARGLINYLKRFQYAAIAQIIDQIIDFEAPPLPRSHPEVLSMAPVSLGLRKDADLLGSFLKYKFHQQVYDFLQSDPSSIQLATLQKIIDANTRLGSQEWDDAPNAIRSGIDTMIEQALLCFKSYYELALEQEKERDLDEIGVTMKRSFGDLTNATLLNTMQLAAIDIYIAAGNVPKSIYDAKHDHFRFENELDQIEVAAEAKQKIISSLIYFNQAELIPGVMEAAIIADLRHSTDTLGCPIGFRPLQLQKIWSQVVEQAEAIVLL